MPWEGANGLLPGREVVRRGPGVAPGVPPVAGRGRGPGVWPGRVGASSLRGGLGRCPGVSRWLGVSRCPGVSRWLGASRCPGARGTRPGLGAGRGPGREAAGDCPWSDSAGVDGAWACAGGVSGARKTGVATGGVSAVGRGAAGAGSVTAGRAGDGVVGAAGVGVGTAVVPSCRGRSRIPGGVGIGGRAAAFLAGAAPLDSFSLSRLSTGASTVDDADRTNSPMSFNMVRTVLLSTPSSFASS
jgi:hypothetical protein